MKEQTRKEMQRKMAEYEMAAPEVSWAEIEQSVGIGSRQVVVVPMWRRRIAAAIAIVLLMTGGTGLWMQHHRQGEVESQRTEQVAAGSEDAKTQQHLISVKPSNDPAAYALATPYVRPAVLSVQAKSDEKAESDVPSKGDNQEENGIHTAEQPVCRQHHPTPSQPADPSRFVTANSVSNTRLTAKVYLGNLMNSYTSSTAFTPMLMNAKPFGKYDDEMDNEGDTPLYGNLLEPKTSIHHHQPLRFGLSLRYDIGRRWSVESGLSYSLHKSDITNQSGDNEMTTEQRLSYIGFPLNVSYRIWSSSRLSLYVSTGGMVEKMINGSRTTQDDRSGRSIRENVSIHPLQFSLNGMVGMEFRLDKSFSFYAEPGLSYYFDNGSHVPTIYQDEPLSPNLSIGLRFNL